MDLTGTKVRGKPPGRRAVQKRLAAIGRVVDARPLRFLLVGATGVGVSTGTLWIGTRVLHLPVAAAGFLASFTSTFTNFLLNDAFTWRDRRREGVGPWSGRLLRYYGVTAVGNVVYLIVLNGLVHWAKLFDLAANVIAIGVGGALNYLIHNVWTWRPDRGEQSTL